MLVVVGNEKGGCGKTTLAVNLAAWAAAEGRDVMLVDADPGQHSALRWASRRREMHPEANPVECVSLTGKAMGATLESLARRYEVVVVDTGAEDSPELRAAALLASVLVVPLQPDALDMWTMPTIETIAARARQLNPALRVQVVLNRVPHQNVALVTEELGAWLQEHTPGLPVPAAVVVGRAAYGRATGEGLGVAEMPRPDPKAAREMEELAAVVFAP